jgi:hypothetical protein
MQSRPTKGKPGLYLSGPCWNALRVLIERNPGAIPFECLRVMCASFDVPHRTDNDWSLSKKDRDTLVAQIRLFQTRLTFDAQRSFRIMPTAVHCEVGRHDHTLLRDVTELIDSTCSPWFAKMVNWIE